MSGYGSRRASNVRHRRDAPAAEDDRSYSTQDDSDRTAAEWPGDYGNRGADGAPADEVVRDVGGVEPAACFRGVIEHPCLIENVDSLDGDIKKDHSDDDHGDGPAAD